ncbi:hypothetical protein BOX15_Mlig028400g2 [Macrostomum lignano]|uniref:Netrin receptor UNC5 n=2 Tax=Macrostomum lignano TaxID=282301 RepID=A0A267GQ61_9PLAT|nr:hypothetical protein BOX15_Mlig028400g2 [Macrostomum lignano]
MESRLTIIFLILLLLQCGLDVQSVAVMENGDSSAPGRRYDSDRSLLRSSHLGNQVPEISNREAMLSSAPKLVIQPRPLYYTSVKTPAVIECAADTSSYVTILCNGRVLNRKLEIMSDHERPGRQRFSVPIEFADVQQWKAAGGDGEASGEEFYCNCEAWNHIPQLNNTLRKIVSRRALVRMAAFESDRFQFDPVPMNVSKSANSVILSCTPPKGTPKPQVKWLKDGQPLDMAALGDRVTIDHQKQLIIRPLELHDRGNYSCVAELPGLQLHSRPAELWIRVDGGWSDWTTMRSCHPSCDSGTECSSDCFAKSSERRRQCTNPEPQFGGQPCQGRAVISEACDAKCTVNGAWSPWSSWSYCGEDCRSLRHRSCTNPAPRNGGRTCDTDSGARAAADKEVRNCTDGQCKKEDPALLRYINGDGKTVSSDHAANLNNLAIYIGLFVAAAVVLTVVMVIVYLVRKKSVSGFASGRRRSLRQHQHHTNVNCSTVSSNDKDVKHTNELLLPPELSSSGTTIKNPNVIEMSQHHGHQQQQQVRMQTGESQLPVHLPMSSTYQSIAKHQPVFHYATCYASSPVDFSGRPSSALYELAAPGCQLQQQQQPLLPGSAKPEQLAWARLGPGGGRVCLAETGVSLTVPPACLTASSEIFLTVCPDPSDRPPVMSDRQTLLSPVVTCGAAAGSSRLARPVVLTLPHAACLRQGFWNVTVLCRSDLDTATPGVWKELLRVGSENQQSQQQQQQSSAFCQLDQTVCHLMLPRLGSFCLVGQSLDGGCAVKQLRLAAFAAPLSLSASSDFSLRLHVLRDTPDALDQVVASERQAGARLIDAPRQLAFRDCGEKLCLSIEELSLGWRSKCKHQEVPFGHVWSSHQAGGLHCGFSLEHVDPTRQSVSCKIVIYQSRYYNCRQVVHIVSSKNDLPCVNHEGSPACPTSAMLDPSRLGLHVDPTPTVFRLPPRLRRAVCQLLDAPSPRGGGHDWLTLSRMMGIERCVNYFACQVSPTECLLDLWEARSREEDSLARLVESLKAINRQDVASLLEGDLDRWH